MSVKWKQVPQVTETKKKHPNEESFRESVRENIELMRALATNGKGKSDKQTPHD